MVAPFESLGVLRNSDQDRHGLRRSTKPKTEPRRGRPPPQTTSGATVRTSLSMRGDERKQSLLSFREDFETLFESVFLESLFSFLVVVWIVRVQPIALGVHVEIGDFGQLGR